MILRFHEDLQHLFPAEVKVNAATPLDGLKLIATQHPMLGKIKPVPVKIRQAPSFLEGNDPTNAEEMTVFDIIPAILPPLPIGYSGAGGDNGLINVVIGVIIIVVAIYFPPAGAAAGAAGGGAAAGGAAAAGSFASYAVSAAVSLGIGLVITGLMQLLAPKPKLDKDGNYSSRTFGARTTTEVGTPIQMVFGVHRIGFHLFSFNVDSRRYDGVDDPENSAYFSGKVDENLPNVNLRKFYGFIQAGNRTVIKQVDNINNRTGEEY